MKRNYVIDEKCYFLLTTGEPYYHIDTVAMAEHLANVLRTVWEHLGDKREGLAYSSDFYDVFVQIFVEKPTHPLHNLPLTPNLSLRLVEKLWNRSFLEQGRRWVPCDVVLHQFEALDTLINSHLSIFKDGDDLQNIKSVLETHQNLMEEIRVAVLLLSNPRKRTKDSQRLENLEKELESMRNEMRMLICQLLNK